MSQNHFTLSFPLKAPADAKAIAEQLPPLDAERCLKRRTPSARFTTHASLY